MDCAIGIIDFPKVGACLARLVIRRFINHSVSELRCSGENTGSDYLQRVDFPDQFYPLWLKSCAWFQGSKNCRVPHAPSSRKGESCPLIRHPSLSRLQQNRNSQILLHKSINQRQIDRKKKEKIFSPFDSSNTFRRMLSSSLSSIHAVFIRFNLRLTSSPFFSSSSLFLMTFSKFSIDSFIACSLLTPANSSVLPRSPSNGGVWLGRELNLTGVNGGGGMLAGGALRGWLGSKLEVGGVEPRGNATLLFNTRLVGVVVEFGEPE